MNRMQNIFESRTTTNMMLRQTRRNTLTERETIQHGNSQQDHNHLTCWKLSLSRDDAVPLVNKSHTDSQTQKQYDPVHNNATATEVTEQVPKWLYLSATKLSSTTKNELTLEEQFSKFLMEQDNDTNYVTPQQMYQCLHGWNMKTSYQNSNNHNHFLDPSPSNNNLHFNQTYDIEVMATRTLPFQYNNSLAPGTTNIDDTTMSELSGINIPNIFARLILCDVEHTAHCTPFSPSRNSFIDKEENRIYNNKDNAIIKADDDFIYSTPFYSIQPKERNCTTTKPNNVDTDFIQGTCSVSYKVTIPLKMVQGQVKRFSERQQLDRRFYVFGHVSTLLDTSAWRDDGVTMPSMSHLHKIDMTNSLQVQSSSPSPLMSSHSSTVTFHSASNVASNSTGFMIAAGILVGLIVIYECFILLSLWLNINTKPIQLSQGPTLVVITTCCIIATASSYMMMPLNDNVCLVRDFFIWLPLTFASNVMNARMWRVCKVLQPVMNIGASHSSKSRSRSSCGNNKRSNSMLYRNGSDYSSDDEDEEEGITLRNGLKIAKQKKRGFEACYERIREKVTDIVMRSLTFLANLNIIISKRQKSSSRSVRQQVSLVQLFWLAFVLTIPQLVLQCCLLAVPSLQCSQQVLYDANTNFGRYDCFRSTNVPHIISYLGFILFLVSAFVARLLASSTRDFPTLFNESSHVRRIGRRMILAAIVSIPILVLTDNVTISPDVTSFFWIGLVVFLSVNPVLLIVRPKLIIVWRDETVVLGDFLKRQGSPGGRFDSASRMGSMIRKAPQVDGSRMSSCGTMKPGSLHGPYRMDSSAMMIRPTALNDGGEGTPTSINKVQQPTITETTASSGSALNDEAKVTAEIEINSQSIMAATTAPLTCSTDTPDTITVDDVACIPSSPNEIGAELGTSTISVVNEGSSSPVTASKNNEALKESEQQEKRSIIKKRPHLSRQGSMIGRFTMKRNTTDDTTENNTEKDANGGGGRGVDPPGPKTYRPFQGAPTTRILRSVGQSVRNLFDSSHNSMDIDDFQEDGVMHKRMKGDSSNKNDEENINESNKDDDKGLFKSSSPQGEQQEDGMERRRSSANRLSRTLGESSMLPYADLKKSPIYIYPKKPLPSKLIRELLRTKPLIDNVLQSTMSGIEAPKEAVHALKVSGEKLGKVCHRLEFFADEQEKETTKTTTTATKPSRRSSILDAKAEIPISSFTGLVQEATSWVKGGGLHQTFHGKACDPCKKRTSMSNTHHGV